MKSKAKRIPWYAIRIAEEMSNYECAHDYANRLAKNNEEMKNAAIEVSKQLEQMKAELAIATNKLKNCEMHNMNLMFMNAKLLDSLKEG